MAVRAGSAQVAALRVPQDGAQELQRGAGERCHLHCCTLLRAAAALVVFSLRVDAMLCDVPHTAG